MSRHHRALDRRKLERWRLDVLERDGWRCRQCGGYANEADHIEPLQSGGDPYDLENGQALCRVHHGDKTALERGDLGDRAEWRAFLRRITS